MNKISQKLVNLFSIIEEFIFLPPFSGQFESHNRLVTYTILLLCIAFTCNNIDFRSPKTYWTLLFPLPVAALISIQAHQKKLEEKKFVQINEKYRVKKESQPLVCKGCCHFDFSKVDNFSYACEIYPHGNQNDICTHHQTSSEWTAILRAETERIEKQRQEAIERLKPVKPQVCESCINYQGVDTNLQLKVCFYYPNGVKGNKCDEKSDGEFRLWDLFVKIVNI